jgi:hypothetical protein
MEAVFAGLVRFWNPTASGRIQVEKGCNNPVDGGSSEAVAQSADQLRNASASTAA